MWDLIKNGASSALSWLGGSDKFGNSNLMSAIGGAGSLWSAYNQNKTAQKYLDMQKDAFDYNKMLSEEERRRKNNMENSIASAYSASSYGA